MVTLADFGIPYIIIMAAVVLVCILDAVSIIRCLTTRREDLADYAEFMIKYVKIAMIFIFGAYYILQTLDKRLTFGTKAVHIIIGVLALIDGIAGLVVKLRYKRGK